MMAIKDKLVKQPELDQGLVAVAKADFHENLWLAARIRVLAEYSSVHADLVGALVALCQGPSVDLRAMQMLSMYLAVPQLETALNTLLKDDKVFTAALVADSMVRPLKRKDKDTARMLSQVLLLGPTALFSVFDTIESTDGLAAALEKQVDCKQFVDYRLDSMDSMAIVFLYYRGVLPKAWSEQSNIRHILDHCREETQRLF